LGTSYSGIFSNREKLLWKGHRVGKKSGERVWPFPKDKDYGHILKSKVADIKQCRLNGGPDHIEASYFLSTFVPREIPWIHVDLSAHRKEGGLAHIPGEVTGFGVRWAVEMAKAFFGEDACSS
jgi:leucyl aminopeptidase